jgi:hypothetical protein
MYILAGLSVDDEHVSSDGRSLVVVHITFPNVKDVMDLIPVYISSLEVSNKTGKDGFNLEDIEIRICNI